MNKTKVKIKANEQLINEVYKKGYTISSFALHIGVHRPFLSEVLYAKRSCSSEYAQKICKGLELSFDQCFEIERG